MGKILARGHSRVPVYAGNPKNIIGLLLVGARTFYLVLTCCMLSFKCFLHLMSTYSAIHCCRFGLGEKPSYRKARD